MTPEERARMALRGYNLSDTVREELVKIIASCVSDAVQSASVVDTYNKSLSPLEKAELEEADLLSTIERLEYELQHRTADESLSVEQYQHWKRRASHALHGRREALRRVQVFIKHERRRLHSPQPGGKADQKRLKFAVQLVLEGYQLLGRIRTERKVQGYEAKIDRWAAKAYGLFIREKDPTSQYVQSLRPPANFDPSDNTIATLLDEVYS